MIPPEIPSKASIIFLFIFLKNNTKDEPKTVTRKVINDAINDCKIGFIS